MIFAANSSTSVFTLDRRCCISTVKLPFLHAWPIEAAAHVMSQVFRYNGVNAFDVRHQVPDKVVENPCVCITVSPGTFLKKLGVVRENVHDRGVRRTPLNNAAHVDVAVVESTGAD